MEKIYLDYTELGGNSYQLGLLNTKNLSTTYFMTILWADEMNIQIIISPSVLIDDECYDEITTIMEIIHSNNELITKNKLSIMLSAIGYTKNPFNS